MCMYMCMAQCLYLSVTNWWRSPLWGDQVQNVTIFRYIYCCVCPLGHASGRCYDIVRVFL